MSYSWDNFVERQGQSVPDFVNPKGITVSLHPKKDHIKAFFNSIKVDISDEITWVQYDHYLGNHERSEKEWIEYYKSKRIVTIGKINIDTDKCVKNI